MFFNSWYDLFRVIVLGTLGYITLIAFLRISGKRTLSKLNMFDFVITIALGSTYASLILSKTVALAEGAVALGLLILLQYVIAWLSVRSKTFRQVVKGEPSLLFLRGQYLHATMKRERIAVEEIRAAARAQGINDMSQLAVVVLETDGTLSVVPDFHSVDNNALHDVGTSIAQHVEHDVPFRA